MVITSNDNFANRMLTFGDEVESGHIHDQVAKNICMARYANNS